MEHSSALAHEAEALIAILAQGTRICKGEFYSKYETMGLRNPLFVRDTAIDCIIQCMCIYEDVKDCNLKRIQYLRTRKMTS